MECGGFYEIKEIIYFSTIRGNGWWFSFFLTMEELLECRNNRGRYVSFGRMRMRVEEKGYNFIIGQDVCDAVKTLKGCMFSFNMKHGYGYIYSEQGEDVFEPRRKGVENYSRFRSKVLFGYFERCFGRIEGSVYFDITKGDDGRYKITRRGDGQGDK